LSLLYASWFFVVFRIRFLCEKKRRRKHPWWILDGFVVSVGWLRWIYRGGADRVENPRTYITRFGYVCRT
jgi:hypothetical protein